MENGESTLIESYDSIYGGQTYTYSKEYQGRSGTIKYMFDDKDNLCSVAFTFSSDSADEINGFYDILHKDLTEAYGKGGFDTENYTSKGDVWYLDDGNIILSTMITSEIKALQINYVSPEASEKQ